MQKLIQKSIFSFILLISFVGLTFANIGLNNVIVNSATVDYIFPLRYK